MLKERKFSYLELQTIHKDCTERERFIEIIKTKS